MSADDPYMIQGTNVLRNKLELTDQVELDRAERQLVVARTMQGVPRGDFNLKHLQAIHRHLFQDVYEWAGELRTLEINKGGSQFQLQRYIEQGMADVHNRLLKSNYLTSLSPEKFATAAAEIIGDVNYAHPFREGNGRTQLQYLKQLGDFAGHKVDVDRLDPGTWQAASRAAHNAEYGLMADAILTQAMGRPLGADERQIGHAAAFAANRGTSIC